jgi:hypothetical protein
MTPLIWLAVAALAAVAAYAVGWPAWRSSRGREARDLNAERYRAWRGEAVRGRTAAREGMTGEERRRIYAGVALAVLAAVALVAFFLAS